MHGAFEDYSGRLLYHRGNSLARRVLYVEKYSELLVFNIFCIDVALVVTRYLNQLQNEKRSARGLRLDNEEAFGLVPKAKIRYSALPDERDQAPELIYSSYGPDFDPYEDIHTPTQRQRRLYEDIHTPTQEERRLSEHTLTEHSKEENYGGGLWTHSQISSEEKARQQKIWDYETDPTRDSAAEDLEARMSTDYKSQASPSFPAPQVPVDTELPRYTLSDHPTPPVL